MTIPELGNLEDVDLRQAWPHEALSFTTLLSENLEILSSVTSGSTFRATHRLPQSSNPDIPAIVVQSPMLSLVFPKRNPASQGNG